NRLDQHFDDATLSWCRLLVLAPRLAAMADRALYDSHALANVARYGVPFGAGAAAAARSAVQQGVGRGDPAHGSASAGSGLCAARARPLQHRSVAAARPHPMFRVEHRTVLDRGTGEVGKHFPA